MFSRSLLGSIFHGFWSDVGFKMGVKMDAKSIYDGVEKLSQRNPNQDVNRPHTSCDSSFQIGMEGTYANESQLGNRARIQRVILTWCAHRWAG